MMDVHKDLQYINNITYIFVSDVSDDVAVVSRVSHKPPLDEGNVQDGRVEIDELENEDFEGQVVVKLGLGPVHF